MTRYHYLLLFVACTLPLPGTPAETFSASVAVDVASSKGPINRAVLGVGMNRGPFDPTFLALWKDALDDTSARIWVTPPKSGEMIRSKVLERTRSDLEAACAVGIQHRIGFSSGVPKIEREARYKSPADNNLDKVHQPDVVAQLVHAVNSGAKCALTGWEIWNEPQFAKKGAWPADDMAAYARDVGRAIHKMEPDISVGVPLYERDMNWNAELLRLLNSVKAPIDFLSFHPYWFDWNVVTDGSDREQSRAIGPAAMKAPAIGAKMQLINKYGAGKWTSAATEWNIHPKGLNSPLYKIQRDNFSATTDMVAALHLVAMVQTFLDEGIGSAQFFDLRGDEDGHFHLAYKKKDGAYQINPTGEALRMLGRHLRGDLVSTSVQAPASRAIGYDGAHTTSSFIFSLASYDRRSGTLAVFLGNRDSKRRSNVKVSVAPTSIEAGSVEHFILTTTDEYHRLPTVEQHTKRVLDHVVQADLPPLSISLLLMQVREQ